MAAVVVTALGCSVAASAPPPDMTIPPPAESGAASSPSPSVSPSLEARSPSASALAGAEAPIAAAAWFLEQSSARFDLRVDRFKPGLPDEVSALGSGVVDPAGDRGRMRFELFPDEPADSPLAMAPFDITWDPDDYWTAAGPDGGERTWQHTSRAQAPKMALIGRVNEEPLALVRFVAAADPATIEPLPATTVDGVAAERWLVPVPFATTRGAFVPPDTYLGFDSIFGLDALPLEVWLIDGRIARVGYVLEREKAPYGGPDRNETWYTWSDIGAPIDLAVPPVGKIVEVYD